MLMKQDVAGVLIKHMLIIAVLVVMARKGPSFYRNDWDSSSLGPNVSYYDLFFSN